MDIAGIEWVFDPAVALFVILTIISIFGRFFRVWLLSCLVCVLTCAVAVIVIITAGQLAGEEDVIRYYITSHYRIMGQIELTLRDILLFLILMVAFQISVAVHTLKIEQIIQSKILWLPRRKSCQYEMEHTLEKYAPEKSEGCEKR